MSKTSIFFLLLAVLLAASRFCHVGILWEGDTLPLAAAQQMAHGKTLYRDVWFDKPPLVPALHLLWGARPGWPLRLGNTLYDLLACWLAFAFARDLWSAREGVWAAGLLGFFLIFDFPSAVIPVASDHMMLAPHLAAVWMAFKRRPFWSGIWAGVAFWVSPKGLFVAAASALWYPAGIPLIAAGSASVSAAMAAWLWSAGALGSWWEQVWIWGRLYAASPLSESPLRNGIFRTLNWMGFHVAIVVAAGRFLWKGFSLRWIGWLVLAFIGVAAGLRFFPRYYFLILPPLVLMAARGFMLLGGRRRELIALLLLIPATRFGPVYLTALRNPSWRDTDMDRDSRTAAASVRRLAKPGDTLFVWGYRPEIFVYTGLPAGIRYLDSQPLDGVPADRHLTRSEPVETVEATRRRTELARSRPSFVLDGLGLFNPHLALTSFPDLHDWLSHYREVGRTHGTIIYQRQE